MQLGLVRAAARPATRARAAFHHLLGGGDVAVFRCASARSTLKVVAVMRDAVAPYSRRVAERGEALRRCVLLDVAPPTPSSPRCEDREAVIGGDLHLTRQGARNRRRAERRSVAP